MNQSCKCDNCGEVADDECPIDGSEKSGCGWELCTECRGKVLEQKIPCCPNCGNVNWPLPQLDENAGYSKGSGRESAAKETVEEGWRHHSEE